VAAAGASPVQEEVREREVPVEEELERESNAWFLPNESERGEGSSRERNARSKVRVIDRWSLSSSSKQRIGKVMHLRTDECNLVFPDSYKIQVPGRACNLLGPSEAIFAFLARNEAGSRITTCPPSTGKGDMSTRLDAETCRKIEVISKDDLSKH